MFDSISFPIKFRYLNFLFLLTFSQMSFIEIEADTASIGTTDEPFMRAIFMGGNWSCIPCMERLPQEYFDWLHTLSVNWVGITVALNIEDSLDSTVERKYEDVTIATFTDEFLTAMIDKFHENGFKIYLTLAIEDSDAQSAEKPVSRWQIGDPLMHLESENVDANNWPWRVDHPNHESFVEEFWRTYTQEAVHFSSLAESLGVEMFSLGTETDRLFRSRSGGDRWTNEFLSEMQVLTQSVRDSYSGLLTYDMHYEPTTETFFYIGSGFLFKDLNLDVIGVSAYYRLLESPATRVLSVEEYEQEWDDVFETLRAVKTRNPNRPLVFTEFGYVDSLAAPFKASSQEFEPFEFSDGNANGLDDGEETQANIIQALHNKMEDNEGVLAGAFLWDNPFMTEEEYESSFAILRTLSVRGKLSEEVTRATYQRWELEHQPNTASVDLIAGELFIPVLTADDIEYKVYMTVIPGTDPLRLQIDLTRSAALLDSDSNIGNIATFDGAFLSIPRLKLRSDNRNSYYSVELAIISGEQFIFELDSATLLSE